MDFNDHSPNPHFNHWVGQFEQTAKELLENVSLEHITSKDRLLLAIKCIEQMQRVLLFSRQIEATTHNNEQQDVIESMKAWMRGPYSSQVQETEGKDISHARRNPLA